MALELIGMENPLRLCDEFFERDVAVRDTLADFEPGELDIETE